LTFCQHNLTHLLLRDISSIEDIVDKIGHCSNLIYLDLSYDTREIRTPVEYQKPNTCLFNMVKDLKNLQYLDISGTNLHMTGNLNDIIPEDILRENTRVESDIVGLRALHKKLKILGLYGCEHAGDLSTLPADRVFSNCNENQLVFALEVYLNRQTSLYHAMNEAYHLYRNNTNCTDALNALINLIKGMQRYEMDTNMITAGTAAIFYILRKLSATRELRRYIARVLITALENMYHDQIVVRNVALTLCQFDFAGDVIDDYVHVMEYILKSMRLHNSDAFTNRVIIYLMNSMACFLNGEQRLRVGEIGVIRVIMNEIIRRRETLAADRVLEACWSFLWNITDETPNNCYRFIKGKGLELMLSVYNMFPNELEIVRNMMGLLGNISEVKRFRRMIMQQPFVPTLLHLLQNTHSNMEVSYNVAAVLANLMSDGENVWKFRNQQIQFKQVYNQIIISVNEWDLQGSRIINYHSLRPIIGLLSCDKSYASQIWAAWTLANLLTTDNDKYGQIFTAEDGVEALIRSKKVFSEYASISKLLTKIEEKLRTFKPNIFDDYQMPTETPDMRCPPDFFDQPDDPPYIDEEEEPEEDEEEINFISDNEDDENTEAHDQDDEDDEDDDQQEADQNNSDNEDDGNEGEV
jgi:Zyg-11 family protein